MNPILEQTLRRPAQPVAAIDDIGAWWTRWQAVDGAGGGTAGLAIAAGLAADRVGWAFAGGYQAALRALVPGLPPAAMAAFCVTEAGGNRPRDIRTTIVAQPDGRLRVDGAKRWTTLGPASTLLLVVGTLPAATPAARPALRVARVPVPSPGLVLHPMPPSRFVPEVPHAEPSLHDVRIDADALLPGDGYDRYVKPFRTLEDVHVTLAVLAYLLNQARARGWPAVFAEDAVAALTLLSDLTAGDPADPLVHVTLAGALRLAHRLYGDATELWAACGDAPAAQRWQRDAALFQVAGQARLRRAEVAWERLAEPALASS